MKVVNKCLSDLVQNETESRCGISILERKCVLNKIKDNYSLSSTTIEDIKASPTKTL